MASNAPLSFLLVVLSLFAAANLADAQLSRLFVINATLCCTPTGACPGPPLANQTVSVVCPNLIGGGNTTIGTGVTDPLGNVNLSLTLPLNVNLVGCRVVVQLPLSETVCRALSAVPGLLVSPIIIVRIIFNLIAAIITGSPTAFSIITP